MKLSLLSILTALFLSGCTEKQQEKATASQPAYVKGVTVRPNSIPAILQPSEACALDRIDDQLGSSVTTAVVDKTRVRLSGWAGNTTSGTSPKEVLLQLEGPSKMFLYASRGLKRPDVAAHFKMDGLADAGWDSYSDLSGLAPGSYALQIIQVDGQSGLICKPNRVLVIQ